MVERHREIDFASGALVFPGGKVDAQDSADDWVAFAPYAAMAPDRVNFVHKHNARRVTLGLIEQIAHAAGAYADKHFNKFGA